MTKEIVRYAIINQDGEFVSTFASEALALCNGCYRKGCTIVKLVGTMPEPKRMKKVALFAYRSRLGNLVVDDYLRTEEEAKERCRLDETTLIKWPYGSVLEIEE